MGLIKYRCVHYREHFWECYAATTYEAAQRAANYWGRKDTCGIDVYRLDIEQELK